jgi:hypothetical protein
MREAHSAREANMLKSTVIAIVATAALAVALPSDAFARRGGGHGGHGGWHGGGGHGGWHGGGFRAAGFKGGWKGGGWKGGGWKTARAWHGPRLWRSARLWHGHRFAGRHRGRVAFITTAPLVAGYYYDDCYQWVPVPTRWGYVLARVWVCY